MIKIKNMNKKEKKVNTAETLNAVQVFNGYLNQIVYKNYCVGYITDTRRKLLTVVFQAEFLEIKVVPYDWSKRTTIKPYCRCWCANDDSDDSVAFSPIIGKELEDIVNDYIASKKREETIDKFRRLRILKGDTHQYEVDCSFYDYAVVTELEPQ